MLQKGNKTIYSILPVCFAVLYSMLIFTGCGSDSSTNTTTDANVVKYDVDVFPTGNNSINLYTGTNVKATDSTKDIAAVSDGLAGYKIETGNLVPPGYKSMMVLLDTNDTKATFDAISTVSAWGTTIDPAVFTATTTGTVAVGQVYGFYLQGKFDRGVSPSKVFGIFRINSIVVGGFEPAKVSLNVKMNKSGANKFN